MRNTGFINLHHRIILVDGHADTFEKLLESNKSFFKPGNPNQSYKHWTHLDFPRMKKAGIDLQFMAIYTSPKYESINATIYAMRILNLIRETVNRSNGRIILIQSARDLKQLDGKTRGFLVDMESALPLDRDAGLLDIFYQLGVRSLSLTQNPRNQFADGVRIRNPRGLTPLGKQVIRRMEKLGMIIDIAHLAKPGFYDVLRNSHGPIICSHTGVKGVCNIFRNIDDDQIKQIVRRKGVIGIFSVPEFIWPNTRYISYRDMFKIKWEGIVKSITVKDIVNNIQYIADKFGVDYVGIGSDFDGYDGPLKGLEDATYLPNITIELVNRGFSEAEIKKILGGNFLRVIRTVLK